MRNAGLEEAQAGIMNAGRNINNLRYAAEKAMATHSSTLAWKIPGIAESGRLQSMGSRRVGHDWATSLSLFTFMHWRRKCNPLQCSCLENPRDGGAWWAAIYGVAQSRTWLKRFSSSSRYADDTTLLAESEEELKSLLMKVKEEWKNWLKTKHSKNEDHGIRFHHFMANRWGNNGNSERFYFWAAKSLQNHHKPWN